MPADQPSEARYRRVPEAVEFPLRFEFRLDESVRQALWSLARQWECSKGAVVRQLVMDAAGAEKGARRG